MQPVIRTRKFLSNLCMNGGVFFEGEKERRGGETVG